jgi:hypothetical protein
MVQVLIAATDRSDTGHPFAELQDDPLAFRRAARGFMTALAISFNEDAKRVGSDRATRLNTDTERKRRAAILAKWYRILTRDMGYSPPHALDEIPRALRAELDRTPYAPPPATRVWAPPQGG